MYNSVFPFRLGFWYSRNLATIYPFQPYRYTAAAGAAEHLVTQPYDKISPAMQQRYLSLSPYNLVRVILGERFPSDTETDNVYTRAASYMNDWMQKGVLKQDAEPGLYGYFQEFTVPDTGERLTRKGFIGLGAVEDYSNRVVHRHEQTLSGPKKDRLELLRHTHAHFGLIFMLYPDREGAIDQILDEASQGPPLATVTDEYDVVHRAWRISDPERVARIQALMGDKKLVIADGHHRYETALAFRDENPSLPGARAVQMAFVNMFSPGLKILATHRLVSNLANFDLNAFLDRASKQFTVHRPVTPENFLAAWNRAEGDSLRIGVAAVGSPKFFVLERPRAAGELDVRVLHEQVLGGLLGISEEAVRDEKNLRYIRGWEPAVSEVLEGKAQITFLLQPTKIEQVADVSFAGGVMPQKSTDFYPKLLSGMTMYKVD